VAIHCGRKTTKTLGQSLLYMNDKNDKLKREKVIMKDEGY
jgi:hypothetical protein